MVAPPDPGPDARPDSTAKSPIQAIDRGVALLETIAEAGPAGIALSSLTEAVGLRASTGRTLLSALIVHGFVAQVEPTRRYVLGPRLFELNRAYALNNDLGAVASPVMRDLWEASGETVHLATLQHGRRVDISVLVSPQLLNVNPIASHALPTPADPLLYTAAGKVLLAGAPEDERERILRGAKGVDVTAVTAMLDGVRTGGYATNHEEEVPGICGIAAPVRDHTDHVVAAMCIGYPAARRSEETDRRLIAATISAADEVSKLLGAKSRGVAAQQGGANA